MIDLTPLEVRQKKGDFRRSFRGYDAELVNDFLDLVADRMEELVKQNMDLQDEAGTLREELSQYRKKEQSLSDALMTAQQLRDDARRHAEKEGELLVREARLAAETARQEASKALAREEETLRQVRARRGQLVESFRRLLERELNELEVIEETLELESGKGAARGAGGGVLSGGSVSPQEHGPERESRAWESAPHEAAAPHEADREETHEIQPAARDTEPAAGDAEPAPWETEPAAQDAEPAAWEVEGAAREAGPAQDLERTAPEAERAAVGPDRATPDEESDAGLLDIESFGVEEAPPRGADATKRREEERKRPATDTSADGEDDLEEDWLKSLVEE